MASVSQGPQDVGKNHSKRKRKQQKRKPTEKSGPQQKSQPVKQVQKVAQKQNDQKRVVRDQRPIIVPKITEPHPQCALCGKPIDAIAQAIGGSIRGTFCHFDCVLRQIADQEQIRPTQKVSYIGRGTFAVIEHASDGKFIIVKRIPYESPEVFSEMKKFVEDQKH